MAHWLLRSIVVETVTVHREGKVLWFPAGPQFRLEREIKNVVTVIAKTNHYWQEHIAGALTNSREPAVLARRHGNEPPAPGSFPLIYFAEVTLLAHV